MTTDQNSNTFLLKNARVVLPNRLTENASVLIKQGRIARVFENVAQADAERVFDLAGALLLPGFIDVHNHGAQGVDVNEATCADLQRVGEFLAREGVTAWLPTLVPAPLEDYERTTRVIDELMQAQDAHENSTHKNSVQSIAARAIGVHYEGPFVNVAQCGALRPAHFRTFKTVSDIDSLPRVAHPKAVHLMTFAPEIEGGVELARELNKRGWVASIGHTRAELEILDEACAAGARHMTHFMNAMTGLHHRTVGVVGWGLMRDDVTCDIIADGIHLDPRVLKIILRAKTPARISLISDSIAPTGLGDGAFKLWGETITVNKKRTQNERGNIAGSVITMRDAVRLMLSLGVSPVEVARMSSLNPARLLKIDDETGSIETGKRADLTAMDENGEVRLTLIGGHRAFDAIKQT